MRVDTALYGEVRSGHALRATSGDRAFAESIANRLDLPSNPPPGTFWNSYLSGFASEGAFVLARIFPDPSASRSGMVAVQAFVVRLAEMIEFANLGILLERMATAAVDMPSPSTFEVADRSSAPPGSHDLVAAANALTRRAPGPVVRLGIDGFDDLIAAIWFNLWPAARASFAFRLSFGPQDVIDASPPTIVCTPAALAGRWAGYRLIAQDAKMASPTSTSAAILSGEVPATGLISFGRDIGANVKNLTDLPMLERAQGLVRPSAGLDDLLGGIRLVQTLSPSASTGLQAKADLLGRLAERLGTASVSQVMALRNLVLGGFPPTTVVWKAVAEWAQGQSFPSGADGEALEMVAATADPSAAAEPWRESVATGVQAGAVAHGLDISRAFWRWYEVRPNLLDAVFRLLPVKGIVESALAKETPRKIATSEASLLREAVKRHWFELHGAVLAASRSPADAIRAQIRVDIDQNYVLGLRAALRAASPTEIVLFATELQDPRLVEIASQAIIATPALFAGAITMSLGEQLVWAATLNLDPALWNAPSNPYIARNVVLDGLLDGRDVHFPLLDKLAAGPLADLSDYPRRDEVWSTRYAGAGFLEATAAGWVRRTVEGGSYLPDIRLERAILSAPELDGTMNSNLRDVSVGLQLVSALSGFTEGRFRSWFIASHAAGGKFDARAAETLGKIVFDRAWHHLLREMVSCYDLGRHDLKPALRVCASMLGIFARWRLSLVAPTSAEKWESFVDLASHLYPDGPASDGLWSRAGGRDADLPKNGTGRSTWRSALTLVRNGGKPNPMSLVKEMLRDYGSNQDLRFLAKDSEIIGYGTRM